MTSRAVVYWWDLYAHTKYALVRFEKKKKVHFTLHEKKSELSCSVNTAYFLTMLCFHFFQCRELCFVFPFSKHLTMTVYPLHFSATVSPKPKSSKELYSGGKKGLDVTKNKLHVGDHLHRGDKRQGRSLYKCFNKLSTSKKIFPSCQHK